MTYAIIEAVIVVEDLAPLTSALTEFGGWRIKGEGQTESAVERLIVPCAGGCGVRLIRPENPRPLVRSNAMPWDTGFVFDLYLNVADIEQAARFFAASGWQAYNDPVEYAGEGWRLSEIIVRNGGGVCLCLMQRHEPVPSAEHFSLGRLGPIFNMAVVTAEQDHDAAVDQLCATLHWTKRLSDSLNSAPPGNTPNGQPHNFAVSHPRYFTQIGPVADNSSPTLQILSFVGLDGRKLAERGHPLALGIRGLRIELKAIAMVVDRATGAVRPTRQLLAVTDEAPFKS